MADSFVLSNDFRGGRSKDIPSALRDTHCAEALNVDYYYSRCGNKRWGTDLFFLGGLGVGGGAFLPQWGSLIRHQPGITEANAELWMFSHAAANQVVRIVGTFGPGAATAPTLVDPISTVLPPKACGAEVRGVTFNGKLFLCYDSAVDRLHVWDGTTVRRVGVVAAALPPILNAVNPVGFTDARKYKMAWVSHVGAVVTARSELSGFTVQHTATNQKLTFWHENFPNPPAGEGHITGWELYGYSDDDSFGTGHLIARTTTGTGITDDQVTLTGDPPPEIGLNTPPSSWKYIMVHGNRLLGAGSWEQPGLNNRVWFTAPLGSGDQPGDDERIPQTLAAQNYLDLDENDGGYIVGFGGVINGSPVVVKSTGLHRLIPTGNAANPYQVAPTPISRVVGGIRQEAIVPAEDEAGNPALYWLARNGPHRYTATKGVEYCGYDIEDLWDTTKAGDGLGQPHGVWYPQKKQVWWYLANGATPKARCANFRLVLHTQSCQSTGQGARGGWVLHTGNAMVALASVLYLDPGAATLGTPLRPLTSHGNYTDPIVGLTALLVTCDVQDRLDDLNDRYQSSVSSPAYALGGLANQFTTMEPVFLVRRFPTPDAADSVFGAAFVRDFNEELLVDLVTQPEDLPQTLTPKYQIRRMALTLTGSHVVQVVYGDVGTQNVTGAELWDKWWGIESLMVQRTPPDKRA